ncbi:MAG: SRPBCC family protein, partial [Actinomycetota bacterium]|nr:SRPBCC family protein [Actinomycetota bacterium]
MHYDAAPGRVWAELADLASHSEWMTDADTVHFLSDQTAGVGTQFRVPTRVGPLRTTDLMTVVEWDEGKAIAVDHQG